MIGAFGIKAGEGDHSQFFRFPVALVFNDVRLGKLVLQFYNISGDGNHFALLGAGGDDGELDVAAFFAAN